ncbi:hypothetical protein Egran_04129 [Elaphomyces granulatus]|uniref:Tim44-like domain-containing protein n=1 Tax=Elaphomyces granulatus TaxID=519963 RepID=A0A232LVR1_9EURO|nr:hypothetical protein Egran_04129 [Elaphomyces granulatus]
MVSTLCVASNSLFGGTRSKLIPRFLAPLSIPTSITSNTCQCRSFSQTHAARARGVPQKIPMKQSAQPSLRTLQRKQLATDISKFPDLGVLQGTFIRPLWRDMPSIFQKPRERLQMEWLWLKSTFMHFVELLLYCKHYNTKLPLRLRGRKKMVRDLHHQMYTAFANADVDTLNTICCPGLARSLTARIHQRPSNELVSWSLDKYLRTPTTFFMGVRILSDRGVAFPNMPDSGVRQIVARVTSRQSTGKTSSADGQMVSGDANLQPSQVKQQNCTEHIVFQRLMWSGEELGWSIWGHANPTTVDDLDSPHFAQGLTASERLSAVMNSVKK